MIVGGRVPSTTVGHGKSQKLGSFQRFSWIAGAALDPLALPVDPASWIA